MNLLRLQKQMEFLIEIDKLKSVYRQTYLSDGSRKENDSEHSWHLAMMVLVLTEHFIKADPLKTLKMVLIHDLVEIYAGDTFAYDEKANMDKEEREKKAAERIFSLLPDDQMAEFKGLWEEFERKDSPESQFAAIVDRIQPVMLNICSKGKAWQEHGITVEQVLKRNSIIFEQGPENVASYMLEGINEAVEKGYLRKN